MAISWFSRNLAFNQNAISGTVVFFAAGIYLAVLGLGAGGGKPSSQVWIDIISATVHCLINLF